MTKCLDQLSQLRVVLCDGQFQPDSCDVEPYMRLRAGSSHNQFVHCIEPVRSTAFGRHSASAARQSRLQRTALPATKRPNESLANHRVKALTNIVRMSGGANPPMRQ